MHTVGHHGGTTIWGAPVKGGGAKTGRAAWEMSAPAGDSGARRPRGPSFREPQAPHFGGDRRGSRAGSGRRGAGLTKDPENKFYFLKNPNFTFFLRRCHVVVAGQDYAGSTRIGLLRRSRIVPTKSEPWSESYGPAKLKRHFTATFHYKNAQMAWSAV